MKSKYLVSLAGIGLLASLAAACGDDSNADGNGGSNATGSSVASTGSKTTNNSATGSGGAGGGDGNDTIDTASDLEDAGNGVFQSPTDEPATLDPADTDVDYYKFTATAGPITFDITTATGATQPIDTVITIYDANKTQIAQNDDGVPRAGGPEGTNSKLQTILPNDGVYYVKVEEFCESALASTGCDANYFAGIDDNQYILRASPPVADPSQAPEAAEPNDTLATATTLGFTVATDANGNAIPGSYFLSDTWGVLNNASDKDWVKIHVPADVTVANGGRVDLGIYVPAPSTDGSGSNVNVGALQVIDADDLSVVGELDFSARIVGPTRPDVSIPVIAGHDYLINIPYGSAAASGSGDFYFVDTNVGEGNPLETAEVTNGLPATPEDLTGAAVTGGMGYFVEGDLALADVDNFRVPVLAGATVSVACGAQRSGSGVRNLKVTVLKDDTTTQIFSDTESATHDITIQDQAISGTTDLLIKLESGTPSTTVTSRSYRCGIYVND